MKSEKKEMLRNRYKECRASQAKGSAMRLSSSVNLKHPVLCLDGIAFLENTFTKYHLEFALVSHRPMKKYNFHMRSF